VKVKPTQIINFYLFENCSVWVRGEKSKNFSKLQQGRGAMHAWKLFECEFEQSH